MPFGTVTIKVEPNMLRNTALEVSGLVRALQTDFQTLQNRVSRTGYYWTGEAADAYRREFSEQRTEVDEILSLLRKYPNDLLTAAQIYTGVEDKNTESIQVLSSNLVN